MKIIERKIYLDKIISKKENGMIKIISGIRRSGKSYLLFRLFKNYLLESGVDEEHIIELALDSDINEKYCDPKALSEYIHSKIVDSKMYYVLLDEIQFAILNDEIKSGKPLKIYSVLNGLLGLSNVDIYVTGSNSRFLSSDILTEFRGRGDEVRVYPLTFSEFYSVFDGDKYDAWREYSTYGGLPQLISINGDENKSQYLMNLMNNVYLSDVVERNNIKGSTIMDNLVDVLASSVGSLTNPNKLVDTFTSHAIKTNAVTVSNYIDYLMDAFLISKAKRYNVKGRKYIGSPFKYYFTDIGLRNARLNFRQQEQTHIMENIIYNELLVRGFNVDVGVVEHTVKDENNNRTTRQLEIDFVCNKGSKRYYIQSAFSMPNEAKIKQEQASFDQVKDGFRKIIVTQDNIKSYFTEDGYLVINLIDFLLDENSIVA